MRGTNKYRDMIPIDIRHQKTQFIAALSVILIVIGVLLHQVNALEPTRDLSKLPSTDHVRGSSSPKVIIYEFSDFECPFCAQHHVNMQKVIEKHGDNVAWVYKHFPLSIHANARTKAIASECVASFGGEDAFWNFTDTVLSSGTDTSLEVIQSIATENGVEKETYQACLHSKEQSSKVDNDIALGTSLGVQGTPGNVIVNVSTGKTQLVSGALPLDQLMPLIEAQL